MIRTSLVVVTLLAPLLSSQIAHAAVYMEEELVVPNPADLSRSIKQVVHTWSDPKHLKQDVPQLGGTVVIDLEKGQVFGIIDQRHQYWKMPVDKYRDQLAVIALAGFGVAPDPKTGALTVPQGLFVQTTNTATIEGRKAVEWTVTPATGPDGKPLLAGVTTSVWVSQDTPFDAQKSVALLRLQLGNPTKPGFEDFFAQWGALGGYPVQLVTTVRTQQAQIITSRTLLTVLEKEAPAGTFAVPKGFALIDDPLTQIQRQIAAQQKPVGIGAPLNAPTTPSPVTPPAAPATGGK
jgi:hypothetical protein